MENALDVLLPAAPPRLAVACSGGADSLALALMAQAWGEKRGVEIIALTVDHGLRPESAAEALEVRRIMLEQGLRHHILKADQTLAGTGNLQEKARALRYRLLCGFCRENHIAHLMLAHHLEDQAETVMLRLARGSGVDGLSAMQVVKERDGVTLLRPLLHLPRRDLRLYLQERGQRWIEDPSNANPVFDRVKWRGFLPHLASLGLTPERLAETAASMQRARHFLEKATFDFLQAQARFDAGGFAALTELPDDEEIMLRALRALVMLTGVARNGARLEELKRLHARLRQADFKSATLAGCLIVRHREQWWFLREPGRAAPPQPIRIGHPAGWDGRFECRLHAASAQPLWIGALTQAGWLALPQKPKAFSCPKQAFYGLPCLRNEHEEVIAAPHLQYRADPAMGGRIAYAPSLGDSIYKALVTQSVYEI
jgi:tRNA(Ile)-lysidine synthase